MPSQGREIVEEIVKRILEDCKDDIDAIKQAHKPAPDPDCLMGEGYKPEYAMYGPLVRTVTRALTIRAVLTGQTGEHSQKDQRDV